MIDRIVLDSVLIFLLIIITILVTKPLLIFNEYGKIKEFGTGPGKTILSLPVVILLLSIVIYYCLSVKKFVNK